MAQYVEALHYKPEGRGFDSRWCHWNFSLTYSFRPHYGPGVDSGSNRNEYRGYLLGGKGGRCVGLTTLPPSCAGCLEIWEPQHPGTLRDCNGIALPFYLAHPEKIRRPCMGFDEFFVETASAASMAKKSIIIIFLLFCKLTYKNCNNKHCISHWTILMF